MARIPRLLDNESGIVEVTSRTIQGRYLTRPSKLVNDLILGVLGRAQARFEVELYAFVFMSNHFHLLMKARSAKVMSDFVGHLKGNLARELGPIHGWEGTFWGGRYDSTPLDDEDLELVSAARFRYILSNGCKEGLVASPLDWPGVSSAGALYRGETTLTGTWYDRSREYQARARGVTKQCGSVETVRLSPLPFLAGMPPAQQREYVVAAVDELERETRERHERNGTRPVGAYQIERREPHDCQDEFEGSPSPWFHCLTRERYRELRAARVALIVAYREAAGRLAKGETDVRFPEGTFPPPAPFADSRAPPSAAR